MTGPRCLTPGGLCYDLARTSALPARRHAVGTASLGGVARGQRNSKRWNDHEENHPATTFAVLLTAAPRLLRLIPRLTTSPLLRQVHDLASKARPATKAARPPSRTRWTMQAHRLRPVAPLFSHLRLQRASKAPPGNKNGPAQKPDATGK